MAVHHAVGISRQRNSGYRTSRVNIMAQGLSTPNPSLSPTHLSIRRGRTTTAHYTHHQVSLMMSRNTTLVPSLGLHIGPACEAGLSAGMQRERVPPQRRKKERKKERKRAMAAAFLTYTFHYLSLLGLRVCKPACPEPGNRESCGRKGIWCKNALGCMAGLTVTLICVAAAGQLMVIQ